MSSETQTYHNTNKDEADAALLQMALELSMSSTPTTEATATATRAAEATTTATATATLAAEAAANTVQVTTSDTSADQKASVEGAKKDGANAPTKKVRVNVTGVLCYVFCIRYMLYVILFIVDVNFLWVRINVNGCF